MISSCIPLKHVQKSGDRRPRFTHEIDLLGEERDRRYRSYKRTCLHSDFVLFRQPRDDAHKAIESAKLLFYYERLSALHNSKQIFFDPQAHSISDYLEDLAEPKYYFPRFSFREVTMDEVKRAIAHFNSQARGTDNVPQSFISAVTPVI